ncbi:MAG: rhamnulokinase family protein [Phycisphaeraceae bacterium]
MSKTGYIAIDLGAESGRVIVGTLSDGVITMHEAHRFANVPQRLPSGMHWDLLGLWGNILDGVRDAIAWAPQQGIELVSLGVDAWGVDWSLLGCNGELLGLPHCYRDERHQVAYEKTLKRMTPERIYERTGIQFMPLNTLYQMVARFDAEPALLENARHLLFMPDLLHYFFSKVPVIESSIASTSQMIDPRTGDWAGSMLHELGLPTQMLTKPVPPGTKIGKLRAEVAEYVNAPAGLQVIAPAAHDTASAVAAIPAEPGKNWAFLSSGTWSLMGVEIDEPCLTDAARAVPFTNEGGVDGTFRFLKNISGLWLVQETRRDYQQRGESYDYAALAELAGQAEPFRTLVNPDHPPFAQPGDMPAKIADFARETGQPVPETVGQFVRCCLESLALTYRATLELLEQVLDRKIEVLHVVGGGGKNELLNQMTADAIARPTIVGPYEATGVGNVLVQAMGAGDVQDLAEMRQIVRASFSPKRYEPQNTSPWDQAYDRLLQWR